MLTSNARQQRVRAKDIRDLLNFYGGDILDQAQPANNAPIRDLEDLQAALADLIPITTHMGLTADHYDGQKLILRAPLAPNVNHQRSAFGGSLFSVSALAGWSILQLKLGEQNLSANTVIKGGDVSYTAPVFEDIRCELTLPASFDDFFPRLQSLGRASIVLTSEIFIGNEREVAMQFTGKYVVKTL